MALSKETIEALAGVSTATLTTCLFKRGFKNIFLQDVHRLAPGPNMVGEAFTLRMIPAREDLDVLEAYADPEHPQRKAVETCPAGMVMIMDSRGDPRGASAGEILVTRMMIRGVAGVVTDGGFRDSPSIAKLAIPTFHQRPSAPTGPIFHHAVDIGLPIACGGVGVFPGDVLVGDNEGVVCLPAHLAAEVAAESVGMTAYEDFVEQKVREGRRLPGLYPASAESRAEFEIWRKAAGR